MSKVLGYIYASDETLIDLSDPRMIEAGKTLGLGLSLGEKVREDNGFYSRIYVVEGDAAKWAGYLSNVAASSKTSGVQFKFTMEVHEHEH